MAALLLKVLNVHQLLGPAERFLLLPYPRVAHMAEQNGINHIRLPLPVGWGGPVALSPPRGGDLGLRALPKEVILGPDPLSGVDPGRRRGGDDLEAPSGVAALGLLSDQAGPGAETPREEAGLGQQGEADHTLDLQPLGAGLVPEHLPGGVGPALEHPRGGDLDPEHLPDGGLVLEHQSDGAGLILEHLLGGDLGPDRQYGVGLVVDHQPGEVAGHALEPQPDVAGHALEPQANAVAGHALGHQLDAVAGHALGHLPGEGGLGLEHQQDEGDPVVGVWLDGEDLTLEHHKEEAGLAHQNGRTNPERLREGAGPPPAWK